ncbi:alpha/beta fold hydrolase [Streptomyces sp. URMC 129]|uniref:alpha/beta hydrolase n=1 Tax=Streptomyces sp. URMC 129 TaxID=3423407 RepID=UPI003F19C91E
MSAVVAGRSDTLPRAAGGALAATAAVGVAARVLRRRRVLRGKPGERLFETGSGNVVAYEFTEPSGPDAPAGGPVLVCEAGLLSTAEHWAWLRRALAGRHPLLTYNRAGYGRGAYRRTQPFTVAGAAADLADLVRHVCGDRPVVLLGHSLGGYIAVRALGPLRDVVTGAVLIDPSHPAELLRSRSQALGAEAFSFALTLMPLSLHCGLGLLLRRPPWVDMLPEEERRLALDHYRDGKLWSAGAREWRGVYADFLNHDGSTPPVGVPLCLVAAAVTHQRDPVQAELHGEFVAASPAGTLALIEDATHDELLFNEVPARRIAALTDAFVAGLPAGPAAAPAAVPAAAPAGEGRS